MTATMRMSKPDLAFINKHSTMLVFWGVILALLGALAISATTMATHVTVFLFGLIITIAGFVMLIDTITFWWRKWTGFFLHLVIAFLYIIAGTMLINHPIESSISITLILGVAYIIIGFLRSFYALTSRNIAWGWNLFNGLITFILGILILQSWPVSALFIVGLFVGIDLVFLGFAYIVIGLAAQRKTAKY